MTFLIVNLCKQTNTPGLQPRHPLPLLLAATWYNTGILRLSWSENAM